MAKGKYQEWLKPEGLLLIEGYARDGLTDEQIAQKMNINVATLYRWKEKYCEICEALKKGKEVVDRLVENALLKRALGYEYDEVTKEVMEKINEDTGKPERYLGITKIVTKQVSPDTTAQIFWLKNRKPGEWRDVKDLNANLSTDKKLEDFFK